MTITEATIWVDQNKGMLAKQAAKYTLFAPYAVNDYLQDAYEAAIKAAVCCQINPALEFQACFMTIWRRIVASVTPFPDEAREAFKERKAAEKATKEGKHVATSSTHSPPTKKKYHSGGTSMSFSLLSKRDIKLEFWGSRTGTNNRSQKKLDKGYALLRPLLSVREQAVMELHLGLSREGQLSEREIAARLGITRDSVREYIRRSFAKAESLSTVPASERMKSR